MTTCEVIDVVDNMTLLQKYCTYLDYRINWKWVDVMSVCASRCNLPKTFQEFSSINNIKKRYAPDKWQARGYAQESWIVFEPGSLYHWIYVEANRKSPLIKMATNKQ